MHSVSHAVTCKRANTMKHRSGRWSYGLTQREDLPQQDAVGPHVALERVHAFEDALWRHPLDRQASL